MSIIGIDLGTTNSVLSFYQDQQAVTVSIDDDILLPSVIHLSANGFIIGKTAKNLAILEPEKTVSSVKRKMGQAIELPIGDQSLSPEELSALILKKIKQTALEKLGLSESTSLQAVITVPAYFTEGQRQATRQAAELAGLIPERIINEPTAAALSFGMSSMDEAIYAVYDLGGGTFDISIIESDQGLIEVLATTGNNELGGDDFDTLLSEHIWQEFIGANKLKRVEKDRRTEAKLRHLAEVAKISLSTQEEMPLTESFFFKHNGISHHLDTVITKTTFENLIQKHIQETIDLLQQAIREAKLKIADIDGILLVGGSSRIPMIHKMIEEQTGILPQLMPSPDEAVAHGAAIQGAIIENKNVETILVDITPYSLGIGVLDDLSEQTMMDLVMSGADTKDTEPNLYASAIISKNTPVPTQGKKMFSAAVPFQETVQLQVFQGEAERFHDNKKIGECFLELTNPPEHPEIEVTFKLNINGILELEAVEVNTQQKVEATFKSSRGQRIRKSALEQTTMATVDDADDLLFNRAKAALENETIDDEDRAELQELLDQYQQQKSDNMTTELETTKSEILDLLYYLESK